jgi:hypothetical protein
MTDEEARLVNERYDRLFIVATLMKRAGSADGAAFGVGAFGLGLSVGVNMADRVDLLAPVLIAASAISIGFAVHSFLLVRRAKKAAGIR